MDDQTLLNEYVAEHDRTLGTCDSYDVKASIWLIVIIFLASQTGSLLGKSLPSVLVAGQWIAAILLAAAGISTLFELRPQNYKRYSPSNGVLERWLGKMREAHKADIDAEATIHSKSTSYRLLWFKEIITENKRLNGAKAKLLMFSFWATAVAAAVNLITLVILRLFFRSL